GEGGRAEPEASPEGMAVDLVEAADLESRSTVAADTPPASTGSLAPQPQRQPPEPPRPPEDGTPSAEPETQRAPPPAPKNPNALEKAPEHPASEPHKTEPDHASPPAN